jgi:hypothetical protein
MFAVPVLDRLRHRANAWLLSEPVAGFRGIAVLLLVR